MNSKRPLGVELLSRGLVTENDIDSVIAYQREHPKMKTGEIFYVLSICSAKQILDIIEETTGQKTICLTKADIKVSTSKYLPMDYIKEKKVIPFSIDGNVINIAFGDIDNTVLIQDVEKRMEDMGLKVEKYLTFSNLIDEAISSNILQNIRKIKIIGDVSSTVNKIILDSMKKRASDIHFEPVENGIRIRIRIDGELLTYGIVEEEHKQQIIGRLKAISNMFQERQESQDGRITLYPDYNIRVSSQKNIHGEKFVLRLLKKNADVLDFGELGYPNDNNFMKEYFKQVNGMTILTAPTGEGKTTTLYSIIRQLNDPTINITTVEDPVEIRIEGLNQIEVSDNISFSDSLRTVLRQDPDIILVGEIRDQETAQIAAESAHTGHYVLTTLHTISALEAITRLRKLGLTDYDVSGTISTIVSQRLVRRLCTCKKEREFTPDEIKIIENINNKYNTEFNYKQLKAYSPVGCERCEGTGYYERIAVYEIVKFDDIIRDMINRGKSALEIREYLLEQGYQPIQVESLRKILNGITTFSEVEKKINLNG